MHENGSNFDAIKLTDPLLALEAFGRKSSAA
jgi:hypothetical protein